MKHSATTSSQSSAQITCSHCQKPSGYDRDMLRHLTGNYELICQKCKRVAVKGIEKVQKFHISEVEMDPVGYFPGRRERKEIVAFLE